MDSIATLRYFRRKRLEMELKAGLKDAKDKAFTISPNISWLYNPSVVCSYCDRPAETGRTWLLDEGKMRIISSYNIKTRGRVRNGAVHPHCKGESGVICMGNAKTVAEAVLFGLYPDSAYTNIREFMSDIGHECGEFDKFQACRKCRRDRSKEEMRHDPYLGMDGVCDICWNEHNINCTGCGEVRDRFTARTGQLLVYYEGGEGEESFYEYGGTVMFCSDCRSKGLVRSCLTCNTSYATQSDPDPFADQYNCHICVQNNRTLYSPVSEPEPEEEEEIFYGEPEEDKETETDIPF